MTAARWLWITPEVTESRATGGLVYSYGLLSAISRTNVDVTVVGLATGSSDPDAIGLDSTARVVAVPGVLRGGPRSLVSTLPNMAFACCSRQLTDAVRTLVLDGGWDAVVIDGLQAAWATRLVERHSSCPIVFITQNHEGSFRREVARQASLWSGRRTVLAVDALKAGRLEQATMRRSAIVAAITADDRARFEVEAPAARHIVLPPGWTGPTAHAAPPSSERPRRAVILGSFDWHVKQENLRRFVSAADRRLGDAGIELVVGGRVPGDVQQEIERQVTATRFVGWLDDIAQFMASARIGVVSEPLGGGFKLKALDYVFHDVPVAALYSSASGLPLADGTSMIGAEDEQRLVTKIIASIDDGEALDGLATAARRSCEAVFSWEASANTLLSEVTAIG